MKCKRNTGKINPRASKTITRKIMLLSKCAICGSKKSRIIKKQEVSGILSNLGLKKALNKIPLLGDILFGMLSNHYKMNEIVNKFLLTGDKFMPEMNLKKPELLFFQ